MLKLQKIIFLALLLKICLLKTQDVDFDTININVPNNIYCFNNQNEGDQLKVTVVSKLDSLIVIYFVYQDKVIDVFRGSLRLNYQKIFHNEGKHCIKVLSDSFKPIPYSIQISINNVVILSNELAVISYNRKKLIYPYNVNRTCSRAKFLTPDIDKVQYFHFYRPNDVPNVNHIDLDYSYSLKATQSMQVSLEQTGLWYFIPQVGLDNNPNKNLQIQYVVSFSIKCVVCVGQQEIDSIENCEANFLQNQEGNTTQKTQKYLIIGILVLLGLVLTYMIVQRIRQKKRQNLNNRVNAIVIQMSARMQEQIKQKQSRQQQLIVIPNKQYKFDASTDIPKKQQSLEDKNEQANNSQLNSGL